MVRTQIQLTEGQMDRLRRLAAEKRMSIAELIRQGVDIYLDSQQRVDRQELISRARKIAGKYSSGHRDISENHDKYLGEDFS